MPVDFERTALYISESVRPLPASTGDSKLAWWIDTCRWGFRWNHEQAVPKCSKRFLVSALTRRVTPAEDLRLSERPVDTAGARP